MSKSKKQDAPRPRPEAAPLPLKRLTEAQKKAGKAIAEMLRDMASDPLPAAFASAQEHSYLPHVDRRRSNRMLLIDGGRGSGKSTLLVTLIHAYGELVLGRESPEKFEAMDDRIIPIGIVDLQPLPPQTNLPLHIAGHIKRVVEVVDPPTAVTSDKAPPIWDDPSLSQLREKWQRLMKLLATWDESLEARLGQPDMSAYVVETIEEELERGQLPERFREAIDVLVESYARRFRWSGNKKPLFLLAIDDADMNPRLSIKLLEFLRKLWHPRLAFLVAGDSELFLMRLQEEVNAQVRTQSRGQEYYRKLAGDIYAKDIPRSARFRLDSLTPEERVKRIREIRKLLKQYEVEVHPPALPREYPARLPTLRDYLLVNEQSAELLPGRLREIDELTASLRGEFPAEERKTPSTAALRVIKWFWDQAVREHFEEDENQRQLIEAVRSARLDGQLRLDLQRIRLRSELEPAARIQVGGSGSTITLQDLNRFQAFANFERHSLDANLGSEELSESLTACWLLAMDVAADVVHGSQLDETAEPFAEGSLQFVVASWREPNLNSTLAVPWMLPRWKAPVDYVLFAGYWSRLLNSGQPQRTKDVGLMARQFLWLAIQIANSRTVPRQRDDWWEDVSDWPAIAEELARLAELSAAASSRQQLNARWAIEEAVLLAAPESCLPREEAGSFLDALMKRFGPLWSASRIQERRSSRVPQSNRSRSDSEVSLDDVDASNPSHPFVRVLKGLHEQRNRRYDTTNLWDNIQRLEVPQLRSLMGKNEGRLEHYGTDLRKRALGNLPKAISSAAGLEFERHQRIAESTRAPIVLVGLWRVFAERLQIFDIVDWFSLRRTEIIISKEAMDFGEELRTAILSGREGDVQAITIDAVRALIVERFAPVRRAPRLPAPLDALFRVIFDYVQDQDDTSAIPAEFLHLSPWPPISTQLRSGPSHPLRSWPAVRWPSLKEYEDFVGSWSDTMQNLKGWIEVDESEHKPYVADSLGLSYLHSCEASSRRQGGRYYVESHATEANFAELLKSLVSQSKTQVGRRDKLFSKWIKSLPLMGTPEAALSDPIAQVFIEHALSTDMDQSQLRELRRERTRADGVPADEVEAFLKGIDESFPKHPWVEGVEARGPADGGESSRKKPRS
jgi:hypothetical protein